MQEIFQTQIKIKSFKRKTVITNLKEQRVKFLGFEIFIEKKRFSDKVVCKIIPNQEAIRKKVRIILDKIIAIRYQETLLKKVVLMEKINSMIIGLSNYYRISIAKRTFMNIDNQIYYTMYKTMRYINGTAKDTLIELDKLGNLTNRHQGYKTKTFFIEYQDVKVGITKMFITPI